MEEIDFLASQKFNQEFKKIDSHLWHKLETEFYARISNLDLFSNSTDSISAFLNLIEYTQVNGYPFEFYIETENIETKRLVEQLKKLNFHQSKDSVQRFLFNQLHTIIRNDCKKIDLNDSKHILIAMGNRAPDSIKISIDCAEGEIYNLIEYDDLKKPGLRKALTILYFSRMSEGRKKHYPQQSI